jgi:ribosome recycling factor
MKSDLGIMPNNDGKIIRLNIPRLTEERRRDLSKLVGKRVEDAKVAVRNVRRDALNDLRDFKNESMIAEDDFFRGQDDLQQLTDRFIKQIGEVGDKKSAEIMEV